MVIFKKLCFGSKPKTLFSPYYSTVMREGVLKPLLYNVAEILILNRELYPNQMVVLELFLRRVGIARKKRFTEKLTFV